MEMIIYFYTVELLDFFPFQRYKVRAIYLVYFRRYKRLRDPDNFVPANPLVTPIHIQPEWYFLFAYAILRSIPNKLGGVIALFISIIIFMIIPTFSKKIQRNRFYPINKTLFWIFISTAIILTWIEAKPVEEPFIITGQILTILYFIYFPIIFVSSKIWDIIIFK